jgi:hypothetical protein
MNVGYARTSTIDQAAGLAARERDLKVAGAERIFGEQISSTTKRAKLAECLAFLREGDCSPSPRRTGWRAARPSCCPSRRICRSALRAGRTSLLAKIDWLLTEFERIRTSQKPPPEAPASRVPLVEAYCAGTLVLVRGLRMRASRSPPASSCIPRPTG